MALAFVLPLCGLLDGEAQEIEISSYDRLLSL